MMTPVLLILAVFFHINGISCDGEVSTFPKTKEFCESDAFVSSKPIEGKVFLFPAKLADRRGDWYANSVYCAANCAEMVTIHSAAQNAVLVQLIQSSGMTGSPTGVWLGATALNKQMSTKWYNGEPVDYVHALTPGELNEGGLTALVGVHGNTDKWADWNLYHTLYFACQRSATWTACE